MINGKSIEQVDEFNFLGLIINEYMSWSSHAKKYPIKFQECWAYESI